MRCAFTLLVVVLLVGASLQSPQPLRDASTLQCITCVATVKGVEGKVQNGEPVIKEDIDKICRYEAPTPDAEKHCEDIADDGLEFIVKGIEDKEPPKKICEQMKKC